MMVKILGCATLTVMHMWAHIITTMVEGSGGASNPNTTNYFNHHHKPEYDKGKQMLAKAGTLNTTNSSPTKGGNKSTQSRICNAISQSVPYVWQSKH